MLRHVARLIAAVIALGWAALASAQHNDVRVRFVHLAQGVPGAYYEPALPGPRAATAVFIMHSSVDYLDFPGCTELAKRGFRVLCANNSTSKSGASNEGSLDRVLLDARAGVAWLRRAPGIRHIVLLGHSGGGTVMSAYQLIAERGVAGCRGADKVWQCPDTLAGLPAADGLMLIDSNWGLAAMTLFSVDPAVVDETSGIKVDPALDLFAPANGFARNGAHYPTAFVARFQQAEGRRDQAILANAQARLDAIAHGRGAYDDDEPLTVPGASLLGGNNKLFAQDVSLMAHTRHAWPLLHAGGRVTTEIVPSVRVPENPVSQTPNYRRGALKTSVKGFLNSYAIRVSPDFGYGADGVRGVDWTSSYASPPGNVGSIRAPLLVMGMTGHWEYLAAETIYERAASPDKTIAFVEGATHGYTTCIPCEPRPGAFGDTQKTTYDYIAAWLDRPGRFDASPPRQP